MDKGAVSLGSFGLVISKRVRFGSFWKQMRTLQKNSVPFRVPLKGTEQSSSQEVISVRLGKRTAFGLFASVQCESTVSHT